MVGYKDRHECGLAPTMLRGREQSVKMHPCLLNPSSNTDKHDEYLSRSPGDKVASLQVIGVPELCWCWNVKKTTLAYG